MDRQPRRRTARAAIARCPWRAGRDLHVKREAARGVGADRLRCVLMIRPPFAVAILAGAAALTLGACFDFGFDAADGDTAAGSTGATGSPTSAVSSGATTGATSPATGSTSSTSSGEPTSAIASSGDTASSAASAADGGHSGTGGQGGDGGENGAGGGASATSSAANGSSSASTGGGLLLLGKACSESPMCASGFCVSDVCCDTACSGACQACTAAIKGDGEDGVCGGILFGSGPNDDACVDSCGECMDGLCEPQCDAGTEVCCHDTDPPECRLAELICNQT